MKQKPEERPFTPSIRFMAFIMPTAANIVNGHDSHNGISSTPQSPHRLFIEALFTYMSQATIRISIKNLMPGERSIMSSIVPMYSIMSIAVISMKTLGSLSMVCELQVPITIPKKTAMPPITGTGLRCSLRASGLSTRFFIMDILRIFG